jgi:hypothetical protein
MDIGGLFSSLTNSAAVIAARKALNGKFLQT